MLKKGGHHGQTIETNMMLMMMIILMIRGVAKKGGHRGHTIKTKGRYQKKNEKMWEF